MKLQTWRRLHSSTSWGPSHRIWLKWESWVCKARNCRQDPLAFATFKGLWSLEDAISCNRLKAYRLYDPWWRLQLKGLRKKDHVSLEVKTGCSWIPLMRICCYRVPEVLLLPNSVVPSAIYRISEFGWSWRNLSLQEVPTSVSIRWASS